MCDEDLSKISILHLNMSTAGGKSDPYFEIRRAFGPGYESPGTKQGKEPYQGKHVDNPLYRSEYVLNDLNPVWKAHVLDLNRCGLTSVGDDARQ